VEAVASVAPDCGSPNGFATVAPCCVGGVVFTAEPEIAAVFAAGEDVPSGFATVAPCVGVALAAEFETAAADVV